MQADHRICCFPWIHDSPLQVVACETAALAMRSRYMAEPLKTIVRTGGSANEKACGTHTAVYAMGGEIRSQAYRYGQTARATPARSYRRTARPWLHDVKSELRLAWFVASRFGSMILPPDAARRRITCSSRSAQRASATVESNGISDETHICRRSNVLLVLRLSQGDDNPCRGDARP